MADPSLTVLLQRFSAGDRNIAEVVLQAVLPELHRIAERQLRDERYLAPVQATELIDEVWLRSLGAGGWRVNDRGHFYAIAGIAMRRVLIDYARQRRAQRRGDGEAAIPLESLGLDPRSHDCDVEKVVELGMLMEKLQESDPQTAARLACGPDCTFGTPEPPPIVLLGTGLLGVAGFFRRKLGF